MSGTAAPKKAEKLDHVERFRRFTSTTVHNLREPVRAIGIYTEMLRTQTSDGLLDDGKRTVELIAGAAEKLQRLLDGLSEFSSVCGESSGSRGLVPLDLVLRHARQQLEGEIKVADGQIKSSSLPSVSGDFDRLVLLFRHLIRNALHYRGDGAPVILIEARHAGGEWVIDVSDNGPGIPDEYRGRVFEPYARLHGNDRPGNGLGLAVCRAIVENHGGQIWAEASPSGGAAFRFTLPDLP